MNNKHSLKLIDGKFPPSQAGKVLFGLLSFKVNHHQMELFSNEERFGKDLSNSKKRIDQLKIVQSSLKEIIDQASHKNEVLKISCVIKITVLDGK